MSHRTLRAILQVCVALALGVAPLAARAVDLTGVTSANLTWTPASGPVAGYGVFIARNGAGYPSTPNFTITTTSATVTGAFGDSLTVRVAAYTATGAYGPSSPDSDLIRFLAPPTPSIAVSTTALSASSQAGTNPPNGSFTVRNAGGGTLSYSVSDNQSWLSVSPASGTSTGEADAITVSYDTTGLAVGSYTGTITVGGGAGVPSKTVTVTLSVTAPPAAPAIALSTSSLSTSVTQGSSPGNQTFTIRNSGGGTLSYSISDNQSWLSVSPASGTSTGESDTVTLSYSTASLTPGSYSAIVTASAAGTASRTVTVSLTVNAATAQPAIQLSTGAIIASTAQGQNASPQTFNVRNSGGGTLSYSISDNQSWLSVSPASGTSTGESDPITVTFATSSLSSGTYTASITASASGVASQSVAVTLTVSSVNAGAGRAILVGVGEGGSGAVEVLNATANFAWNRTLGVDWSSYNASVGETRPVACDLDGDGNSEYVVGLGTGSNGRLEVLQDGPGGFVHLAWLQVTLSAYDAANGETFPACGDIDGDGRDEIVVGLGSGGGGRLQIFDDATTGYAVMSGTPIAGGILQVDYTAYNNANGETHPAVGDFDGDGRAEIAVGLGSGGIGWIAMFEDKSAGFAPMAGTPTAGGWIQIGWSAYYNVNGATYPAAGDIDGDGKDELVVGLGAGGQGYVRVLDDKTTGFAPIGSGWLQLDSASYNAASGATFPTVGNLDGDDRDEILVGLAAGAGGQMKAWDDVAAGFAALPGTNGGWITVNRSSVTGGGGATRPTIGNGASATPPPPPGVPAITLSTTSLSTTGNQGGNASSRTFTVRNSGSATLSYSVTDDQSWMSVSPASGTSTGESDTITVTFPSSGLTPATRTGSIVVSGGSGVPSQTISVTLTVLPPGSSGSGASAGMLADFNGDNLADVVHYDASTGQVSVSLMNGFGVMKTGSLGTIGAGWELDAVGDTNGDKRADLLWRNASTGDIAVWLVNGTGLAGGAILGKATSAWQIIGSADFNGDKQSDIFYRNSSTGEVAIWYLNGVSLAGGVVLGTITSAWTFVDVADLNGDGRSDIVWRNPSTGQIAVWLTNGYAVIGGAIVGTPSAGWQLQGVGDFNGDKRADLLFRHSNGQIAMWMLNGGTVVGGGVVGSIDPAWQIAGVTDVNGDGKADILWKNTSTGQYASWWMNGYTAIGAVLLPNLAVTP